MLLFAGPLLALALSRPRGAAARHAGHGSSLWAQRITHLPLAQALRNWVTAPLLEEFLFRGCLLSYLLVAGASPGRCVALSPALFAACHLHHLNDLVRFQVGVGARNPTLGLGRGPVRRAGEGAPPGCQCVHRSVVGAGAKLPADLPLASPDVGGCSSRLERTPCAWPHGRPCPPRPHCRVSP